MIIRQATGTFLSEKPAQMNFITITLQGGVEKIDLRGKCVQSINDSNVMVNHEH